MVRDKYINPVLYVILNGGLHMSVGKAASQAVHAAMMLPEKCRAEFSQEHRPYKRTVIILEAKTGTQLDRIATYLSRAGIHYETYIDEGKNEVEAFSMTALAVETIDEDDTETREILSALPLYGDRVLAKMFGESITANTMSTQPPESADSYRLRQIENDIRFIVSEQTAIRGDVCDLIAIQKENKEEEHETKKHYFGRRNR